MELQNLNFLHMEQSPQQLHKPCFQPAIVSRQVLKQPHVGLLFQLVLYNRARVKPWVRVIYTHYRLVWPAISARQRDEKPDP